MQIPEKPENLHCLRGVKSTFNFFVHNIDTHKGKGIMIYTIVLWYNRWMLEYFSS